MSKLLLRLNKSLFNEDFLNNLGRTSGAIKRCRKVNGSQLADLLMFDADGSLNGMSMQLLLKHGVTVSKQALHQKFSSHTVAFMQSILETLLSVELPAEKLQGVEIMIKDSTRFALPENIAAELPGLAGAGMQAGAAVQFEFGLKSGRVALGLTAANANDQSESRRDQASVCSGALHLRDLGYAHIGYMNNLTERDALFVNRLNPQTQVYIRRNDTYELLDLTAIKSTADMPVYIGKQKFPVRLIIEPVSEPIKAARIAKVNRYNKKKGLSTTERFRQRAGFNFILTNLDKAHYDTSLLQKIYRLRWQVELVFKAWKSMMQLHLIGNGCIHRIWCRLYGKLIWVILGWKITISVGKIGQVSLLKMYGLVAATAEVLRQQLWRMNDNWLSMMGRIPLSKIQREQRNGRLKLQDILLNI